MGLKSAKLEFCNNMVSLLEGLDTETAQEFIKWLASISLDRDAHYFEFWQEKAEIIYCTEKPYQEVGN